MTPDFAQIARRCTTDGEITAAIRDAFNAGLERAAGICQYRADENAADQSDQKSQNDQIRAIKRIEALLIRNRILASSPAGNARVAVHRSALEQCALIADGYGWTGRESTRCDSYGEGRRDCADSIASAIRAEKEKV